MVAAGSDDSQSHLGPPSHPLEDLVDASQRFAAGGHPARNRAPVHVGQVLDLPSLLAMVRGADGRAGRHLICARAVSNHPSRRTELPIAEYASAPLGRQQCASLPDRPMLRYQRTISRLGIGLPDELHPAVTRGRSGEPAIRCYEGETA